MVSLKTLAKIVFSFQVSTVICGEMHNPCVYSQLPDWIMGTALEISQDGVIELKREFRNTFFLCVKK